MPSNKWTTMNLVPTSGLQTWNHYDPTTGSALNANNLITDFSGNSRDLTSSSTNAPVLTTSAFGTNPGWLFDGSASIPVFKTGSVGIKHVFVLASHTDATFGTYRGILSDATSSDNAILVGDSGTTKFVDFDAVFTSTYKKSNTTYAHANQQAPISGNVALLEVQIPAGVTFSRIQVGKDRDFAGRIWKGYFFDLLIYNRVLSEAERKAVMMYFNLRYGMWNNSTESLSLYFPSDDILTGLKRRRFYAEPPDYQKITDQYEYEDGGKDFNEVGDTAPRRWEYDYNLVNTTGSTDPGEVRIFDEFYDEVRMVKPFTFTDKYGVDWSDVRVEKYDRSHEAHKPWRQSVKFKLIKYP